MNSAFIDGIEYRFVNHIYCVSQDGAVLRFMKPYTPTIRSDGYLGIGRQQLLHRAVARVWCHRPEGSEHVHHINEIKTDNRASNLIWVSAKDHMANHHCGRTHRMTDAGKQRLRELRAGSVMSDETKHKIRIAIKAKGIKPPKRQVGYKCSHQAIQAMIDSSPNAKECEINGVVYRSFAEASRALSIKRGTIRKRCLSAKFTNYLIRG